MPSIGSLKIRLGMNLVPLVRDIKRSEFLLKRSAAKYKALGSTLTTSLTLPILGAGAASAKLATDLGSNFAKIENLVGITGNTLDQFKAGVSNISTTVAKSQASLSDALFAITSGGQRGAEALLILEQSSKASQIGLGDVTSIARASTAVLNAYGKANISAARSVDVLTAIVREGNLEAESLAPSLGRVIGLAAQMGVSFEEAGASVATFTRLGVSSEEAITGLRAILAGFLKPTSEASNLLKELGLSAQQVRDSIKTNGLADTLIDLKSRLGGNDEQLAVLIPNIRALSAVLGTAGSQAESYREVLDNLSNSAGIVNQGFENVSKTAGFQFQSALVNLQNAAIELGAKILPVITNIVSVVSGLITKFRSLDDTTKNNVIRFAAFAAIAGPVITAIGSLKSVAATALGVFRGLLVAVSAVGAPVALIVAGLALGAVYVVNNWEDVRKIIVQVTNSMITLYNESLQFRGLIEIIVGSFKFIVQSVKDTIANFSILGSAIGSILSGDLGFGEAFSKAKDEFIAQAEESTAQYAKILKDGLTNVIEPREILKIDENDVQASIAPMITAFKNLKENFTDFFQLGGSGAGGGQSVTATPGRALLSGPEAIGGVATELVSESSIANIQKLGESMKFVDSVAGDVKESMAAAAQVIANNLGASLARGAASFKDFASNAVGSIKEAIAALIQLFVANAISSLGPVGLALAPIIGGLASGVFNTVVGGAVPAFASGGVITKPTLGLVGEYAGASQPGNYEIITPEKLMRRIIREEGGSGGPVGIYGRLKGDDIHLANNRAAVRASRTTIRA